MINYLVGKKAKLNYFVRPFDNKIINFLDDLSKTIDSYNIKNYSDLKSLSFFCRRNNILNLKVKNNSPDSIRFGMGLVFHVTPSNVPTNFAYSLIFGLITGNSNIVKVPTKKFEEITIICKAINKILLKRKYKKIKNMISIIRYSHNDEITNKFSLLSDVRMIWGGDKTVENIKKSPAKSKTIDIPFSDRYSVSLINSEKILKLNNYKMKILSQNFYNDTYTADQNACSSPHLILWNGKLKIKAKKKFWNYLSEIVKKKYDPPSISSIDNYSKLISVLLKNKNFKSYKKYNKSMYTVSLKNIRSDFFINKTKWGFFYEYDINELNNIKFFINRKLQTLTYFGFPKKFLINFFRTHNFNGIDRVVPIGQALNIGLLWDGYDLFKMLSREIEIK